MSSWFVHPPTLSAKKGILVREGERREERGAFKERRGDKERAKSSLHGRLEASKER